MILKDDRTPEQKQTHRLGVVMRDNFLSGWGHASAGYSRCAWAVPSGEPGTLDKVERWVRGRKEGSHVRVVDLRRYRPSRGTVHFHIYVVGPEHTALREVAA